MTPFPTPCPSPARRVRRAGALVGLTVLAPVPAAWAQDATHGQALYQQVIVTGTQTCAASACHGSAPSRNQNKIASGASAYTIATGISGVSQMRYRTFVIYNVVGGLLWGVGVTTLGYFLGEIDFVKENIEIGALVIVAVSVAPMVVEFWRHRRRSAAAVVAAESTD